MKALRVFFSTLLSGKGVKAERAKYHAISYVCSFVNIIHLVTFLILQIHIMVFVNLLCLLSLFIMKKLIPRDRFFACMLITYSNFYLHQIIVSIWIGWTFGFTYYIFGMIPVIFYLNFSNPISSKKARVPINILLVSLICFLGARYISSIYGPIQRINSVMVVNTIFSINCIICFLFVMLFCALYIEEMKAVQHRLREQNGLLRQLADSDPLTSLLNRRSMLEHLRKAFDAYKTLGKNYCVIICDIDDFKNTNDTYGHDCGDKVLVQIADLMKACLGEESKISRWGGEEILMLVPWELNLCIEKIEDLRKQLETYSFIYQQHEVHITMTFGIKTFDSNMSVQQIIQLADSNLYEGKKIGKNCIVA
jgi:diguanylate cyclase (GGDEF)-like protein